MIKEADDGRKQNVSIKRSRVIPAPFSYGGKSMETRVKREGPSLPHLSNRY
jgi:hypothetical protein